MSDSMWVATMDGMRGTERGEIAEKDYWLGS